MHRASQVLVGDELLDEVQREVHKGCSPGLDRHAQYSQQTCQQPFLCYDQLPIYARARVSLVCGSDHTEVEIIWR